MGGGQKVPVAGALGVLVEDQVSVGRGVVLRVAVSLGDPVPLNDRVPLVLIDGPVALQDQLPVGAEGLTDAEGLGEKLPGDCEVLGDPEDVRE